MTPGVSTRVRRNHRRSSRWDKPQVSQNKAQVVQKENSEANRSYQHQLNEYSTLRLAMEHPATSSNEVIDVDASVNSQTSIINIPDDDSEIEEGEIVEREVTQCVDLIEESFNALKRSGKIQDLSPFKQPLFYEDKTIGEFKHVDAPVYNLFDSSGSNNESIISLDSSGTSAAGDDSVIFVSEQNSLEESNQKKLLKSPNVQKGKKLSPSQIKRRERLSKWHQKKKMEYAMKEMLAAHKENSTLNGPSTSTAIVQKITQKRVSEDKKKRIILIDGSNVAITYAKSALGKDFDEKNPNAFSVEGKF